MPRVDASADLDQFESRLKSHFKQLAAAKNSGSQRLFALEHCLKASEVQSIRQHLGRSLELYGMTERHKHCWLVHSAEHGYTFEGLEYWQSFATLTPKWAYYGDRGKLRDWFDEFAVRYNGVRPVGRWGQHFRYIAWPITNALLPSDLQIKLAQTLFQLRYRLDELMALDHEKIGQMVERHAEWPSTRYEHFLEQHDLVGRVVRALLEENPSEPVIFVPTLERITRDLNTKGQARAWLRDAKRSYDNLRAKLGRSNPTYLLAPSWRDQEDQQVQTEMTEQGLLLRPRIQLRQVSPTRWGVWLLVPSFQALVNFKPQVRDHLMRVRYTIPAHAESLFLGQSLLSGHPIPRKLMTWPKDRVPLLKFDKPDTIFDRIVDGECQLLPAKVWVFACTDDGSARFIQGQYVRAGNRYIVVSKDSSAIENLGEPISLECDGVAGVVLEVPDVVNAEFSDALKHAGIALHGQVFIEPIGLRPRQWNEGGFGEWLSTETPLFALTCEFGAQVYQVELDGNTKFDIPRARGAGPTLVGFRDMSVGYHRASIRALTIQESAFAQRKCLASADIELFVRHPTTWSPFAQLPAAIVVDVDPAVPSLDDFLEQHLQLRAEGDVSRSVKCNLVLTESDTGSEIVLQMFAQQLPITHETWRTQLRNFLRRQDELQIINASQATIMVQADDLGEVRVPLQFEVEPLRWTLKKNSGADTLRLIDEGVTDSISVAYYDFEHPLRAISIDLSKAMEGIACAECGGLYVARAGTLSAAIAITKQDKAKSFAALGVAPGRNEFPKDTPIEQLLEHLRLWKRARAGSYMARLKQHSVSEVIRVQLLFRICGPAWMKLEKELEQNECDETWTNLENGVSQMPSFAIGLADMWKRNRANPTFSPRACLEGVAKTFKITEDPELSRLAWDFASNPIEANHSRIVEVQSAGNMRVLVRGARLLVLCQDKERGID